MPTYKLKATFEYFVEAETKDEAIEKADQQLINDSESPTEWKVRELK